ncbi:MAG: FAD-dependent oxidoreductase, partial [Bacilli bacterium]
MKVIVIGAVAGGLSAALKLKRNLKDDVSITIYEKSDMIAYGACGLPYYIGGLIEDINDLVARSASEIEASGVSLKLMHEVVAINHQTKEVTITNLLTKETINTSYDKLIIASGARAQIHEPLKQEYTNVLSLRTLKDGLIIKEMLQQDLIKKVIVVGAGYIGLEIVEAISNYNKDITLIEANQQILNVIDNDMIDQVKTTLINNNVTIYEKTLIKDVKVVDNKVIEVVLEQGLIPCDLIINCAGIKPNTSFITNIDKAHNGALIVDETMATSVSDIYAAGDCSIMKSYITKELNYAPLGTNANKQGRIIADVIALKNPRPFKLIGSSAIKLFDLHIARVGLSEQDALQHQFDYGINIVTGNSYASYYAKDKLTMKIVYDKQTHKILGVQAIGHG